MIWKKLTSILSKKFGAYEVHCEFPDEQQLKSQAIKWTPGDKSSNLDRKMGVTRSFKEIFKHCVLENNMANGKQRIAILQRSN